MFNFLLTTSVKICKNQLTNQIEDKAEYFFHPRAKKNPMEIGLKRLLNTHEMATTGGSPNTTFMSYVSIFFLVRPFCDKYITIT